MRGVGGHHRRVGPAGRAFVGFAVSVVVPFVASALLWRYLFNKDFGPINAFFEWIGLPEGYIENYQIDNMHVVRHVRTEWQANWKTGVDAFYETYHLPHIHPQTQGVMEDYSQYDTYPNGFQRMIVPICTAIPSACGGRCSPSSRTDAALPTYNLHIRFAFPDRKSVV